MPKATPVWKVRLGMVNQGTKTFSPQDPYTTWDLRAGTIELEIFRTTNKEYPNKTNGPHPFSRDPDHKVTVTPWGQKFYINLYNNPAKPPQRIVFDPQDES